MSKPVFKSNRPEFMRKNNAFVDMVQEHMTRDIEIAIKTTAGTPYKTGAMKSGTRHFKSPRGGYRVEMDKVYAAYQERGSRADGSHQVKNYSHTGTGKGFFVRSINMVIGRKNHYFQEARRALNL